MQNSRHIEAGAQHRRLCRHGFAYRSSTTQPQPSTPSATRTIPALRQRAQIACFTVLEDGTLTKALIRISEDTVSGSDRDSEYSTRRITYSTRLQSRAPFFTHSNKSVKYQVRKLFEKCLSFAFCVVKAEFKQSSGANNEDSIKFATVLYKKL